MRIAGIKKMIIVVVAALVLFANATAGEKSSQDAVYELFDAMKLSTVYEKTIVKMVDLQVQQKPNIAPFRQVLLDFFDKYMGWESIKPDMARLYAEKFTTDEIRQLIQFYKTPLGEKVALLLPEMSAEGAAIGQRKVQENMAELTRMINEVSKKMKNK